MSRKREERREKERALSRQLGTKDDAKVGALLGKPRTADITLRPGKWVSERRPRSLFSREPEHVVLALWLASPDGVQVVGAGAFTPATERDAAGLLVPVDDETARAVTKVRVVHHRPAHLALFGFLVPKERDALALARELTMHAPRVVLKDDVPRVLDDAEVARYVSTGVRTVGVVVDGARPRAGCFALFPAAGAGNHTVNMPLTSDDGAWAGLVTVSVLE